MMKKNIFLLLMAGFISMVLISCNLSHPVAPYELAPSYTYVPIPLENPLFNDDFENGSFLSSSGGTWSSWAANGCISSLMLTNDDQAGNATNGFANHTLKMRYGFITTNTNPSFYPACTAILSLPPGKRDLRKYTHIMLDYFLNDTTAIYIKFKSLKTDSAGGYDHYRYAISLSGWRTYETIPFTSFAQGGWGTVVPLMSVLSNVLEIQISVDSPIPTSRQRQTNSLYIDNISILSQ